MNLPAHRPRVLACPILVLALAACGGHPPAPPEEARPVPAGVEFEPAALVEVPDELTAVATLEAIESARLASRIMGRVVEADFEEGDAVTRGQALVRIDAADLDASEAVARAGLAEAEANLARVRADAERYRRLGERKAASDQEVLAAETALRGAEARVEAARRGVGQVAAQRAYATVAAPFDGRVVRKLVRAGDLAAPGQTLAEIAGASGLRAVAEVAESAASSIVPGSPITVALGAAGEAEWSGEGSVEEVVPASDPVTRTTRVRIALPSPPEGARPGMFARVRFALGTRTVLAVPSASVVRRGGLEAVFVESPRGPVLRLVRTGAALEGGRVEIRSGLAEGERCARSGLAELAAGSWEVGP